MGLYGKKDEELTVWQYNQENVVNYNDDEVCPSCGEEMMLIYDDLPNGPRFCLSCR
ncbi:hypothetical protein [Ectobacillus ponti]|uniref:Uncharacterized protein n=1 Tax=Ectobacillus ponti TaxID=2961894 RepID=A0AA41X802_9BACI|nr:hypothetical protein [Ectobacillus ponti]MCP8970589.1 hypothetical protein [Ectobacillus ponti]